MIFEVKFLPFKLEFQHCKINIWSTPVSSWIYVFQIRSIHKCIWHLTSCVCGQLYVYIDRCMCINTHTLTSILERYTYMCVCVCVGFKTKRFMHLIFLVKKQTRSEIKISFGFHPALLASIRALSWVKENVSKITHPLTYQKPQISIIHLFEHSFLINADINLINMDEMYSNYLFKKTCLTWR